MQGRHKKQKEEYVGLRLRRRIPMILFAAAACVLICSAFVYLREQEEIKLRKNQAEKLRIEHMIEQEKERAKNLEEYRTYVQTDSYLEQIAREVLGLVYKNEVIFRPAEP